MTTYPDGEEPRRLEQATAADFFRADLFRLLTPGERRERFGSVTGPRTEWAAIQEDYEDAWRDRQ